MDTYIGFDSAWTDKSPGAICAVVMEGRRPVLFHPPQMVSFNEALHFICCVRDSSGTTLVAIDQPTLVPNASGNRPVEKVASKIIGWMGGGVQPANTSKIGMFSKASPIWHFLDSLSAIQNPEEAREATEGLYLIETFPALALASLHRDFFARLGAPKYNPGRKKTYRRSDWDRVATAAETEASMYGCYELTSWCAEARQLVKPVKADQDRLDALLCLLIGMRWRLGHREDSVLLGDLTNGYMVLPVNDRVHARIASVGAELSVSVV